MLMVLLVGSALLMQRLGETRMHVLNRRFLLHHGGRESLPRLMGVWFGLDFLFILGALLELHLFKPSVAPLQLKLALLMLMSCVLLRFWVRRSMGRLWTQSLVVVPGVERIAAGPYKYLRHPDYIGRVGELLAFALLTGAYFSLAMYAGFLLWILPPVLIHEKRQLGFMAD